MNLTRSWNILNPIRLTSQFCRPFCSNDKLYEELILKNTVITRNHLTPEIALRLITADCEVWHAKHTNSIFPNDPFWGIYWPGGQALGRFILDNKHIVTNKNIIDIGSGSGACAVAAAMCGAHTVLANDTDAVSTIALKLNSVLNNVEIYSCQNNLIGKNIDAINIIPNSAKPVRKWDVILVGDMFYDTDFSQKLFKWLVNLAKEGKEIFVGDPGRHAFTDLNKLNLTGKMNKVVEYNFYEVEHNGYPVAAVYKVEAS